MQRGRFQRDLLYRIADWLALDDAFRDIDIVPDAASLILFYHPGKLSERGALERIAAASASIRRGDSPKPLNRHAHGPAVIDAPKAPDESRRIVAPPGEAVRAKDIPHDPRYGSRGVIASTVAALVAGSGLASPAVVTFIVAISAIPVTKRVYRNLRARRFTMDEIDLLNIAIALFEGAFLPAALISWLVNVGEVIRQRTIAATHQSHRNATTNACAKCRFENVQKTELLLENALLTDTDVQDTSSQMKASATLPFFGLAGLAALFTRDIGLIVAVLKPLYDFSGAIRFGMPATLLQAMSHAAHHGPIFRSGRAVEKLAKADAIVFFTTSGFKNKRVFRKRMKQLINRGVQHFILPTASEAARVEIIALSAGRQYVMAEPMPADPHLAIDVLLRHGHTVAAVEDGSQNPAWFSRSDLTIGLPGTLDADIRLIHADLRGIGHTINLARHAMNVSRQNLAVAAAAATVNLALAFVPALAATTISTLATGLVAANIRRELIYEPAEAIEAEVQLAGQPEPDFDGVSASEGEDGFD